jgi:hypothetical protein
MLIDQDKPEYILRYNIDILLIKIKNKSFLDTDGTIH